MIEIKNLSFCYADSHRPALKDLSIRIPAGEFVGVTGPTGAGKSTLTLCLNGVIPHFQTGDFYGEVRVNGLDTVDHDCRTLASSIGSVFQDPEAQIVSSVVEDEIAFGMENINIPREQMTERITESLKLTGISHLRSRSTSRLSGGQKQRVAIAAAIALRPKVLVLDEPTSELDPQGSSDVFETLKKLNHQYGMTIVVVEQKIQLLAAYCSRLVVMEEGSIVLDGETRSVLARQEVLGRLGINSPPVAELVYLLKKAGLYNGEFPVNVEETLPIIRRVLAGQTM